MEPNGVVGEEPSGVHDMVHIQMVSIAVLACSSVTPAPCVSQGNSQDVVLQVETKPVCSNEHQRTTARPRLLDARVVVEAVKNSELGIHFRRAFLPDQ